MRYSAAPHSTQGEKKINGLCVAQEQWNTFSNPKSCPGPSVSILQRSLPNNRPCVATPALELRSKRRRERPRGPPHPPHTTGHQIYRIASSQVIDPPPDAVSSRATATPTCTLPHRCLEASDSLSLVAPMSVVCLFSALPIYIYYLFYRLLYDDLPRLLQFGTKERRL